MVVSSVTPNKSLAYLRKFYASTLVIVRVAVPVTPTVGGADAAVVVAAVVRTYAVDAVGTVDEVMKLHGPNLLKEDSTE